MVTVSPCVTSFLRQPCVDSMDVMSSKSAKRRARCRRVAVRHSLCQASRLKSFLIEPQITQDFHMRAEATEFIPANAFSSGAPLVMVDMDSLCFELNEEDLELRTMDCFNIKLEHAGEPARARVPPRRSLRDTCQADVLPTNGTPLMTDIDVICDDSQSQAHCDYQGFATSSCMGRGRGLRRFRVAGKGMGVRDETVLDMLNCEGEGSAAIVDVGECCSQELSKLSTCKEIVRQRRVWKRTSGTDRKSELYKLEWEQVQKLPNNDRLKWLRRHQCDRNEEGDG